MDYLYDHVRLEPQKQIGVHSQSDFELSWIVTGKGERTLGSETKPFAEGEVVLVPPRLRHCWAFNPQSADSGGYIENVCFHFSKPFLERVMEAFPATTSALSSLLSLSHAIEYRGEGRERIIKLLKEIGDASAEPRPPLVLSLMLSLSDMSKAGQISGLSPMTLSQKRMEKIRVYISCNYRSRISLDEIASYAGMNRSAFCTFFKAQTGKTFVTYLNEYRIEKACELLSGGEYGVMEVCEEVGFASLAHFCRTFQKIKACAPSKYRREG